MNQAIKTHTEHHHDHCEKCDTCENQLKHTLYCDACDKIQHYNNTMNYFSIFGVPPSFRIDREQVNTAFENLILALHPDLYVNGSKEDQALSLSHTALLYDAKDTLFDPFRRGKYLLSVLDQRFDGAIPQPPQEFIFEMFEIQEELDEIQEGRGNPEKIGKEIAKQRAAVCGELESLFEQYIQNQEDKSFTEKIAKQLSKLKFIKNLDERAQMIQKQS